LRHIDRPQQHSGRAGKRCSQRKSETIDVSGPNAGKLRGNGVLEGGAHRAPQRRSLNQQMDRKDQRGGDRHQYQARLRDDDRTEKQWLVRKRRDDLLWRAPDDQQRRVAQEDR
jgi:hypothetical protein